jgi:hypothetical protein
MAQSPLEETEEDIILTDFDYQLPSNSNRESSPEEEELSDTPMVFNPSSSGDQDDVMDDVGDIAYLRAKIDDMTENEALLKQQLWESEERNSSLKSEMTRLELQYQERIASLKDILEAVTSERDKLDRDIKTFEKDGKEKHHTQPRTPGRSPQLDIVCKEISRLSDGDVKGALQCMLERVGVGFDDLLLCKKSHQHGLSTIPGSPDDFDQDPFDPKDAFAHSSPSRISPGLSLAKKTSLFQKLRRKRRHSTPSVQSESNDSGQASKPSIFGTIGRNLKKASTSTVNLLDVGGRRRRRNATEMPPNEYRTDISPTTTIKRQRTLEAVDNRPGEAPPKFDITPAAEDQVKSQLRKIATDLQAAGVERSRLAEIAQAVVDENSQHGHVERAARVVGAQSSRSPSQRTETDEATTTTSRASGQASGSPAPRRLPSIYSIPVLGDRFRR